MRRLFIILSISLFINSYKLHSQAIYPVDKWMEYVEDLAEETEDTERIENLYADLSYLSEHPFELNTVTEEQLKRLPFLSDRQIARILSYRERYGKILTVYELKNIEELDYQTISLLLPFVYIGDISVEKRAFTVKNMLKYGRNELQIRYDRCFQQKKGYRAYPDSVLQQYPNRKYRGEPFYHSLRYSYTFDDRLQAGFVAEKDAGEPFWNVYHKGYDFYSAHFFLKDMGWLKSLAIGDYKMSFGQGLVVSNDFSPSRTALVTQAERRTNGFRRHYSTNEQDFFRGMAATIAIRNVDVNLFCSYRKLDAGVDSFTFTSLKTDGLHRLRRDWEKRRTVPLLVYGGNIRYAMPDFHIGLTALSYSFGKYRMEPDLKPYNLFYFRGSNNINIGVDYMWKNNRVKLFGETALSKNGAVATLNALALTPTSYISFLALYRYYDRRYLELFGNAFAQGSTVQNEQGLYMGLRLTPVAYWRFSFYADLFRFPWLKYGIDVPSTGQEYMAQVDYTPHERFTAYLRYKYRKKAENDTGSDRPLVAITPYRQHRLRFQQVYNISSWVLKSSWDGVLVDRAFRPASKGMMLSQHIGWRPATVPFQWNGYVGWFHTDDYGSRISSYEKNILYAFNMPSFYGHGIRVALTFRLDLWKCLSLSMKIAHTSYFDRDLIGTDTEEIAGSRKTDLYALLRWKF